MCMEIAGGDPVAASAKHHAKGVIMIRPTIGRVVHYYTEEDGHKRGPLAALVCGVKDDHTVNLSIFTENGQQYPQQNVHLRQPEDADNGPCNDGWAEWMPFQVNSSVGSQSGERAAGVQEIGKPAQTQATADYGPDSDNPSGLMQAGPGGETNDPAPGNPLAGVAAPNTPLDPPPSETPTPIPDAAKDADESPATVQS